MIYFLSPEFKLTCFVPMYNAAKLKKKALCLLTVTDSFINKERKATPEERMTGLANMVQIAVNTAERFAK